MNYFSFSYLSDCSYLEYLKDLEEQVDNDWAGLSSLLDEIRMSLLSKNGCLVNLTADGKNLRNSEKFVSKFLDLLPSSSSIEPNSWNTRLAPVNEAIVIPTQVKWVSLEQSFYSYALIISLYSVLSSTGQLCRKSW